MNRPAFVSTTKLILVQKTTDVSRLLAALGYMPFAVTLMAKLGLEGQSTAKDLLENWL